MPHPPFASALRRTSGAAGTATSLCGQIVSGSLVGTPDGLSVF